MDRGRPLLTDGPDTYDALSRRVLLRSHQDSLCTTECLSHITRFVRDGDQLLHELRAAGGAGDNPESESGGCRNSISTGPG